MNNNFPYGHHQPPIGVASSNQNVNHFFFDQKPSTSGMQFPPMPMQPLNPHNQMPRNGHLANVYRQNHLQHWLGSNPMCNNYGYSSPSPAPSVLSHSSAQSAGSVMSRFSQLTINTNLTVYSHMPQNQMMNFYQPGTENIYPQGGLRWDQNNVDQCVKEAIHALNETPLWKLNIIPIINLVQRLVHGRTQQNKTVPAPIDCVDKHRYLQLLTAMFRPIVFIEDQQNEMDADQLKTWNNSVNKLLKYLSTLFYHDLRFETLVEEVKIPLPDNSTRKPLWILATLLIPDREYTYHALALFNGLLKLGDVKKRHEKARLVTREIPFAVPGLVKIVVPFNEYMNNLERQLALDTLAFLTRRKELMKKILEAQMFPEMLRRYFKPDGDEGVLHKIPSFMLKFVGLPKRPALREETKECREAFFHQFEAADGYTYIREMLVHGSPRVLTACLQFLSSHEDIRIRNIPQLGPLVVAVLKLVGSSEIQITQPALQFLFNAVANNQAVKLVVTQENGVGILLAALRQRYQSFDPKITAEYIKKAEREIKFHGIKILITLVKSYEIQNAPMMNPERMAAIRDAFKFPELSELICNWCNEEQEEGRLEIIRFSRNILDNSALPSQAIAPILVKTFWLDDRSKQTNMVQTFAELFVTFYNYHDQILHNLREDKRIKERLLLVHTCVQEIISVILALCVHEPTKKIIADLFGRTNPQECLVNLFRITADPHLRLLLLHLMCSLTQNTSDPILSCLPSRWATFPDYQGVLIFYKQHNETCKMAEHLLQYPTTS